MLKQKIKSFFNFDNLLGFVVPQEPLSFMERETMMWRPGEKLFIGNVEYCPFCKQVMKDMPCLNKK